MWYTKCLLNPARGFGGSAISSPSWSGQSPAAERYLLHFGLKKRLLMRAISRENTSKFNKLRDLVYVHSKPTSILENKLDWSALRRPVPQLLWWPPGVASYRQPLAQLRYKLTSRGRRDRKNFAFSLPLQAQLPNMQLKLLHTNSQATPLVVHKLMANGSPVRVLPLPQRATNAILINLMASPPLRGKRSLELY